MCTTSTKNPTPPSQPAVAAPPLTSPSLRRPINGLLFTVIFCPTNCHHLHHCCCRPEAIMLIKPVVIFYALLTESFCEISALDFKSGKWRTRSLDEDRAFLSFASNDDNKSAMSHQPLIKPPPPPLSESVPQVKRLPRHWSTRKRAGQIFTPWSLWTPCDETCRQKRERYCKNMRKCSDTKHVEERRCPMLICRDSTQNNNNNNNRTATATTVVGSSRGDDDPDRIINSNRDRDQAVNEGVSSVDMILQKFAQQLRGHATAGSVSDHSTSDNEYYVIKTNNRKNRDQGNGNPPTLSIKIEHVIQNASQPLMFTVTTQAPTSADPAALNSILSHSKFDYQDDNHHQPWPDYEEPDYEDYAAESDEVNNYLMQNHNENSRLFGLKRSNAMNSLREKNIIDMTPSSGVAAGAFGVVRNRRVYTKWSKWSKCTAKCTTRRFKRCRAKEICGNEVLREVAYCYTEASFCEQWIVSQMYNNVPRQNVPPQLTSLPPPPASIYPSPPLGSSTSALAHSYNYVNRYQHERRREQLQPNDFQERKLPLRWSNAVSNNQCGVSTTRGKSKSPLLSHMLRIIGGKSARKGQWPWQVAIFNRFKEAFCGGTLISPIWVITAAHCVRKRLYVRLGEHNLEIKDGTEVEYRVEMAIKHPKYDKRTVDNDVALLKLPKEIIPSAYIGIACLPQRFQNLPIGSQCTVIGWGKRKNQDDAGTKVLHEAEVPIVTNDECKAVYYDYTITKNMFCAGHKRGRIDTCAGDSGGPLLCRDLTKINRPWTIFGITSFGDGCGKRNKFGIYTKIPNYIDWIQSIIECNGACRPSITF